MAKYTVDHTCGHTQTHQLYGPQRERDNKLNWLATTLCSECYHGKCEQDREAANKSAAEQNASAGLPALTGTERQIAWAESIRKPICDGLRAAEAKLREGVEAQGFSDEIKDEVLGAVALLVDRIVEHTEAHWWIETGRFEFPGLTDTTRALFYLERQIEEKRLCPLFDAEIQARAERKAQERKAEERRAGDLLAEIAASWCEDGLSWDEAGDTVSGTIGGHGIKYAGGSHYTRVEIDGQVYDDSHGVGKRLAEFRNNLHRAATERRQEEALASLAAVEVASVTKTKQEILVTLTDGRELRGYSDRSGWHLDHIGPFGGLSSPMGARFNGRRLPSDHPNMVRLAGAAKATHKLAPKGGA